jgi:multidrug efflux system membrane fusion protein
VGEARANEKLAADDLARARRLFEDAAISKAELDAKIARAASASAQVNAATSRSSEANVSLGDTVLRAPMDGVVLTRQIEVGTLVSPGQPVIGIADTSSVKAVFGAPQLMVEKLHVGSPVQVFVGAEGQNKAPEKLLDARVTRIAPAADANGRLFSVEAALANQDGELRPGSVVSVHVPDEAKGNDLAVPLSAVVRSPNDPRGFSVFVLDGAGDRAPARLRDVHLGDVVGNSVTVTEGLASNQRVVTVGATLLHDGIEAVVIR